MGMKQAEQLSPQEQLEEYRQLWIDTLSHVRHDWLNDLQLISAYAQLRKYDKLLHCVDMLKQKLTGDSRISRIGHPGLTEALLTYRARQRPFSFDISLDSPAFDFTLLPEAREPMEMAVRQLLIWFEHASSEGTRGFDNRLNCGLRSNEEQLEICFTYRGSYAEPVLLRGVETVKERLNGANGWGSIETYCEPERAVVTLRAPIGA